VIIPSPNSGSAWGASWGAASRANIDRDRAEEAEHLTRFLSRAFGQEIARLKDRRENDPQTQELLDFLTAAKTILDQIADSLQAAKNSDSPKQKEQNIVQAETLLQSLAAELRGFAERNRTRIVDAGGNATFIYLTTALFTMGLGVSPDMAFGGVLGMFAFAKK
jgi:hypothetical protein